MELDDWPLPLRAKAVEIAVVSNAALVEKDDMRAESLDLLQSMAADKCSKSVVTYDALDEFEQCMCSDWIHGASRLIEDQ